MATSSLEPVTVYEHLLPVIDEEPPQRLYMPGLTTYQRCSMVLGLLVGVLIYLSTLGAEFVSILIWGRHILESQDAHTLLLFSLGWNLFTTVIAVVMLATIRVLIQVLYQTARAASAPSSQPPKDDDPVLNELLSHMEHRFAAGALVGIVVSWNVSNVSMGLQPQILQSLIILALACTWCKLTLGCFAKRRTASPSERLVYDNLDEEENTIVHV